MVLPYSNRSVRAPTPPPPPRPNQGVYGTQQPRYAYNYNYRYYHPPGVQAPPPPPPPPPAYTYGYSNSYGTRAVPSQQYPYHPQYAAVHPQPPQAQVQTEENRKRKRPQEEQFTCETCSVTVDSEQAYQAHLTSHIKCRDCDFMGAPKVVKAHHQSKHGKFSKGGFKSVTVAIPGCPVQRFKICVGSRPEDIAEWIAERKKRFPRRQQKKQEEQKEETNRGEEKKESAGALSGLLEGYGSSSSEEEDNDETEKIKADEDTNEPETTKANEEINPLESKPKARDETETKPEAQDESNSAVNDADRAKKASFCQPTRICRFFARQGRCRNGDACNFRHERPQAQSDKSNGRNQHDQFRGRQPKQPTKTLLRSLLEKDIQRETELSLQLIRHIAEQNFFYGKEQTSEE